MRLPLPFLILLSACGLTNEGPFPSLQPRPGEQARTLQAPGAGSTPSLSAEERSILKSDLVRNEKALASARNEITAAEADLTPALRAASGAPIGSEAWSIAQLKLSRYDQARSPLAEIAGRIGPSRLMVDSLPENDADRRRLLALDRETEALLKRTNSTAQSANRALSRG